METILKNNAELISDTQIYENLRRTSKKGLISLINKNQLIDLALKYFGVYDDNHTLMGYTCPYSGRLITDFSELELEHIIPISSNGGTALFNCIPASKEVNGFREKSNKNLIEWWANSKYWDSDAPKRLEKLVNYILDGYKIVFKEYTAEEVETSYLSMNINGNILKDDDDLTIGKLKKKKIDKERKIQSYLGFLNQCIAQLNNNNIDTNQISDKIESLEANNIFQDIDRYTLFQNILQKCIKERINENDRSYLRYSLNLDIMKLMKSISSSNKGEIYNEISNRLTNIETLLNKNNLSLIDYFESLTDISDNNIIYKNISEISDENINIFIKKIKVVFSSKVNIFIEMLNNGNSNVLMYRNNETFNGHPNIPIGTFWSHNRTFILSKLNDSDIVAKQLINEWNFSNDLEAKTKVFIEMLNNGNSNILMKRNNETFNRHPNIPIGKFWETNRDFIVSKLKDSDTVAKKIISEWNFSNDLEAKTKVFIEMLNNGNSNILMKRNNETFNRHPNIPIGQFWSSNREFIVSKLIDSDTVAKKLINEWNFSNDLEAKTKVFIEMLNDGNSNILIQKNNETFKGHPNIPIGQFWSTNRDFIVSKLKDSDTVAKQLINEWNFSNDLEAKTKVFIEMLNDGNSNILIQKNNETFKGHPNIPIGQFWSTNRDFIVSKLKDSDTVAKQLINEWNFSNDLEAKTKVFIEMLNDGNSNILIQKNNETFNGHPNIPIGFFWSNNRPFILSKLNDSDIVAKQLINEWNFSNDLEAKTKVFIEMLNNGNSNILMKRNNETFNRHPNIPIGQFWRTNRDFILSKLFIVLKDNAFHDKARQTVLNYYKVNSIEEYYQKQEAKKKKSSEVKKLRKIKAELENYQDSLEIDQKDNRKRA